jgi:hypothetical protein
MGSGTCWGDARTWNPPDKSKSHYARAKSKNPCPPPVVSDPIPEPASFALFGLGALAVGYGVRRHLKK